MSSKSMIGMLKDTQHLILFLFVLIKDNLNYFDSN